MTGKKLIFQCNLKILLQLEILITTWSAHFQYHAMDNINKNDVHHQNLSEHLYFYILYIDNSKNPPEPLHRVALQSA